MKEKEEMGSKTKNVIKAKEIKGLRRDKTSRGKKEDTLERIK